MSRVVLSTSSSGLDNIDIRNNIDLIRLRMYVNNVEFIDGKNITTDRLNYLMTEVGGSAIYTSPAPASEVEEMFIKLYRNGCEDLFITTLSSQISESYRIISEVAQRFSDRLNVYVYDTKEINVCEAVLALEAEYLMQQGESMPNIAKRLDVLRDSHTMLFAIEDLKYLIKNKKLSATAGFFANLFGIKPVLQVTDAGLIEPISRIRKFDRALDHILNELGPKANNKESFSYVLSSNRPDMDRKMLNLLQQRQGITDIPVLPVSSISLANHGSTAVGLCIFEGERPHVASFFEQ